MSDEEKAAAEMMNGVLQGALAGMATQTAMAATVGHVIEDESRAWDGYVGNAVTLFAPSTHGKTNEEVSTYAIEFADAVLKARRERFGVDQVSAKMSSTLETANEKCGNKIVGGKTCLRQANHEGLCRS